MDTMQIGEVAERTGLSMRTIRHYDNVGLAPLLEAKEPVQATAAYLERVRVAREKMARKLRQADELIDALQDRVHD